MQLTEIDLKPLVEEALDGFLPGAHTQPESLHRAMRYAVFAGGKRLRPQFLLKVTQACGLKSTDHELALRAACAVELIHVAALVHDDLPCFDNTAVRNGHTTIHVLFGEALALLVSDALRARSFELLAAVPRPQAARALHIVRLLAGLAGSTSALFGGQSCEEDGLEPLRSSEGAASYHQVKTGTLFALAAEAAAVVAGAKRSAAWAGVGRLVGREYQLAYALKSLPEPTGLDAVRTASAAADQGADAASSSREALQAQFRALSGTLHQRICELSAAPLPLLEFLHERFEPLLQKPGPLAAVSFSGTQSAAGQAAARLPKKPEVAAVS